MPTLISAQIAATIDHTHLYTIDSAVAMAAHAETEHNAKVEQLCKEAMANGFAAVCVRPSQAPLARRFLGVEHSVKLATVVGFPDKPVTPEEQAAYPTIGACSSTTKLQEIVMGLSEGVEELDVVMNVEFFKTDLETGGDFTEQELGAVLQAAGGMATIKWIIETDLLSPEQIVAAVKLAARLGVDCIKTCTGFVKGGQGATPEIVTLIKQTLLEAGKPEIWIKASGGIQTAQQALALLEAGASRLGTSRAMTILSL